LVAGSFTQEGLNLPLISTIKIGFSWQSAAAALVLALVTGILAALTPAAAAAELEPVQAIGERVGRRIRLRKLLAVGQVTFSVLVLVVLTSSYSMIQSQESAEIRETLGQDRIIAAADPIAALRKPVPREFREEFDRRFAKIASDPRNLALLQARTPLVKAITPVLPLQMQIGLADRAGPAARVFFTTAETFSYPPELKKSEFDLTRQAFADNAEGVVINRLLSDVLFGPENATGKKIDIAGKSFIILAVRQAPSATGPEAWVPIGWYELLRQGATQPEYPRGMEFRLEAIPINPRQYPLAINQLREALLPLLPVKYQSCIKFSPFIPTTTRQFIFQHKAITARGAVGALAIIVVALIGLTNMLLVSVNEAIHETGLRRALGAKRRDVISYFLSEGVLISVLGTGAGLALGILFCWLTRSQTGFPIMVSIFWATVGSLSLIIAGTIVSLLPALIAARVNPVDALRYE
jgi:hypothetical protein